jgi:hypothetical protein
MPLRSAPSPPPPAPSLADAPSVPCTAPQSRLKSRAVHCRREVACTPLAPNTKPEEARRMTSSRAVRSKHAPRPHIFLTVIGATARTRQCRKYFGYSPSRCEGRAGNVDRLAHGEVPFDPSTHGAFCSWAVRRHVERCRGGGRATRNKNRYET